MFKKLFGFLKKDEANDEVRVCKKCNEETKYSELFNNYMICPKCGTYARMSAKERLTHRCDLRCR